LDIVYLFQSTACRRAGQLVCLYALGRWRGWAAPSPAPSPGV